MGSIKVWTRHSAVFVAYLLIVLAILKARPLSFTEPPLFNPGRGFSMAVLLVGGPTYLIPLALGSAVLTYISLKHSFYISFFLAFNSIVSISFSVWLVKKLFQGRNPALNPKDWFLFLGVIVPISLIFRFALDAVPIRIVNLPYQLNWSLIYSQWLWVDLLGILLSFPFFMELFDFFKTKRKPIEISKDLLPFLIGNLMGVFVFFDPGFHKFGLPHYLPFYLALTGMIGIAYFVNPLLLSFSVLFQGFLAAWGREGAILGSGLDSDKAVWDVRVFMFALGIITPVLSSLFKQSNADTFKKSFSLVSSALSSTNTENDLIRVASKSDTVAVGVFDMNYRVLHMNEKFAEIAGTPLDSQIGKTSEERIGPNSRHMTEVFEKVKKTGKPIWNYRVRFEAWHQMRKQDRLVNYIPVFSKSGEVVGVIVVSTEITDSFNTDQQLKFGISSESGADTSKVLALAVTHDLQEPLRNVNQSLKILKEKFKSSGDFEMKSFVESALEASSKVHSMLKGSLELTKLDYEQPVLINISFQSLVEEIVGRYKSQLDGLGAKVNVETLSQVKGDRELIERLIQNLLSNSIKYRSDKPLLLKISGSVQGKMLQVCFSDNGIGFDSHEVGRIFSPYQRLHSDDEISGYGLGLSICKKIVELHGGKIWAESQPGQGAHFYFTLPVA